MTDFAKLYLEERPDASFDGLAGSLEGAIEAATAAWPELDVEPEEFVRALAGLPRRVDEVGAEAGAELALALACARGERAAIERLEADYFGAVEGALRSMKLADDLREEVTQEVRRKLLVGDGGPPKLVGYAGRGSLRGLLKVTATRTAISMLRKLGRESPGDEAILDAGGEIDPELDFLKAHYRVAFREAFEDAVSQLAPRERNLLRLHFLRKVTLEALATMYGVHRATIVRHLAKVRGELERETQRGLRARLATDRREIESIMDLIRSRFDVSVERILRTMDE